MTHLKLQMFISGKVSSLLRQSNIKMILNIILLSGIHWPLHSLSNTENITGLVALGAHLLSLIIIWKMFSMKRHA